MNQKRLILFTLLFCVVISLQIFQSAAATYYRPQVRVTASRQAAGGAYVGKFHSFCYLGIFCRVSEAKRKRKFVALVLKLVF